MNTFTPADFDFTFLEEGFCARDIIEQKINELSLSVSLPRLLQVFMVLYAHVLSMLPGVVFSIMTTFYSVL